MLAQKRKKRSERPQRELLEEKDDLILVEDLEDFAFEEMAKMLQFFDNAHPLLFAIGSLKELGLRRDLWDNEGD